MKSVEVSDHASLVGDATPEEHAAGTPAESFIRGSFLHSIWVHFDPNEREELTRILREPPVMGMYLPFREYPVYDYVLLLGHLARKLYPAFSLFEGVRLLSRQNATVFLRTKIGRVLFESVQDELTAIRRFPVAIAMVRRGGQVRVEHVEAGHAVLHFNGFGSCMQGSMIGTVEGWLMRFNVRPTIRIDYRTQDSVRMHVTWQPAVRQAVSE